MIVKVIILRRAQQGLDSQLLPMLIKLRAMAMQQPGYVSGETLISADDPEEVLVISTWRSVEDWNAWLASEERAKLQGQIDALIGNETLYQVYYAGN